MKKVRRILLRAGLGMVGLFAVLGLVSLDTVDHQPYTQSAYYTATHARLNATTATNRLAFGPLQAGFGHAKLTPEFKAEQDDPANGKFRSVPLAGYGARKGAPAEGVHDEVHVKAVAVRVGDQLGVMVAADALIIPREVAELALEDLRKLGLCREQVYFSATHTHCSLGGWGDGIVAEMFAGKFQPGARTWFAACLAEAARQAVEDLKPAAFGRGSFSAPDFVRNRLVGDAGQIDPEFSLLVFRQDGGRWAVLGSFSAHATVLSSRVMEFSGDYPGAWQQTMEERTDGMALFLAGGVGSHSPRAGAGGFEGVERMGRALAERSLEQLTTLTFTNRIQFGLIGTEVDLPALHTRVSDDLRLRPWIARHLLGTAPATFMQAFRFADTIWVSTPCDYSGELALQLKETLAARGLRGAVTSFNGDYIGYVIPSKYYGMDGYEPRTMSFFGPATGDYVSGLVQTLSLHLAAVPAP